MANNKKNSISEAMNELTEVKEKLRTESVSTEKITVKNLQSLIAESLNKKVVKEEMGEEEEEIDSVETTDVDNTPVDLDGDAEEEITPTDDMGGDAVPADDTDGLEVSGDDMPLDTEPVETGFETVDLTGASDEEVLSVFKKMNPEDEIEVKMHSDGDIEFKDGDQEYIIATGDSDDEMEPAPEMEPEVDVEPEMGPEMDAEVELDTDGDGDVDSEVDIEPEGGEEVDSDEIEADLENLNEDSDKREMSRVNKMGNQDKGHEQVSDKPKEVEPGSDADGEKPKETIVSDVKEVEPGSDAKGGKAQEIEAKVPSEVNPGEEKVGKLNESLVKTRKRLATTISENISLKDEVKRLKEELENKTKKANKLDEDFNKITSLVGQHTKVSKNLKSKLTEMTVFAQNLTNAIKILSEETLTKDEKRSIVEKFDSVQTIEESENVYNQLVSELHSKSVDANEVITNKLNESVQSGSKQINQSTVHSEINNYKTRFQQLVNR